MDDFPPLGLGFPIWDENKEPRFVVQKFREDDHMVIQLRDNLSGNMLPFSFRSSWLLSIPWPRHRVSLKWRWWQWSSPAERTRNIFEKAQRKADKLNNREMYLAHEAEIMERRK